MHQNQQVISTTYPSNLPSSLLLSPYQRTIDELSPFIPPIRPIGRCPPSKSGLGALPTTKFIVATRGTPGYNGLHRGPSHGFALHTSRNKTTFGGMPIVHKRARLITVNGLI